MSNLTQSCTAIAMKSLLQIIWEEIHKYAIQIQIHKYRSALSHVREEKYDFQMSKLHRNCNAVHIANHLGIDSQIRNTNTNTQMQIDLESLQRGGV